MALRQVYKLPKDLITTWYPKHMANSMREMQAKLRIIDIVIEVHDARIPFTGRNPNFDQFLSIKPKILVFNKKDLVDSMYAEKIINKISLKEKEFLKIIFASANDPNTSTFKDIIPMVIDFAKSGNRFNRTGSNELNLMVIGIPNVGKSSMLNFLRNRYLKRKKASAEGPYAGVTRAVLNKIKIHSDPKIYVIDTPGIMAPHLNNSESLMRLALCAAYKDSLIGEELICDYLLYWLNKRDLYDTYLNNPRLCLSTNLESHNLLLDKIESYVPNQNMDEISENIKFANTDLSPKPIDNYIEFLMRVAISNGQFRKVKKQGDLTYLHKFNLHNFVYSIDPHYELRPDISTAAKYVLRLFRSGQLGRFLLDDDML